MSDQEQQHGAGKPHEGAHNAQNPERPRVGRCSPPLHTRWKPGQSGNPGGRPKGESLVAMIRRRLAEDHHGKTLGEIVVEALIKGAIQGKPQHLKELLDRVEGKVTEKLDLSGSDPLTVRVVYDDEPKPPEPKHEPEAR
jgi:hypothetical protein